MVNKKFILNIDDFGLSKEINRAVVEGYNAGLVKSASLCANGEAFDTAVNDILPECPNLCTGVHLNIIEGLSLRSFTELNLLTDVEGNFKNGFIKLLALSSNQEFLNQVELEFRAQIEKVMSCTKVSHIDSHVHVHSIPNIFRLTCKLANEYGIPFIRTQYERPYFTPDIAKHVNFKYPVNIIKIILLNSFSVKNKIVAEEYGLKTNDYLVGVGYTGMMDVASLESGLKVFKNDENIVVESLIHPFCSELKKSKEFDITKESELTYRISRLGFEVTNYRELTSSNYEKV